LCFEDCSSVEDHHLAGVGNLLHLKCLKIHKGRVRNVPREIAKLPYLETVFATNIPTDEVSVPATISLCGRLVFFTAGGFKILGEIEGTETLEMVGYINANQMPTNSIRRLGGLTNLRHLTMSFHSYEDRGMACSIRKLVKANLRSLVLVIKRSPNSNNWVEELNLPAECGLRELSIEWHILSKVPRWMGSLINLQKLSFCVKRASQEEIEILASLPDLRYIKFGAEDQPGEQLKAAMEILIAAHPNHPKLHWTT
jgi:disease resistance protein RPM1